MSTPSRFSECIPAQIVEERRADPPERAGPRPGLLPEGFIGRDPRILEALDLVMQVADTDATVLITGESGTGKEHIARALHEGSARRRALFLAINCGAIAETLQESELFGHAKGAFTGASGRKVGLFEAADGGTIFLDEVGEMSRPLQVKLLRVLQSGEFTPVGVAAVRRCDVRIVAASNQDLTSLIAAGQFRRDLYHRLNVIRIGVPPLRERRGDIRLLIDHYLRVFGASYRKPDLRISAEVELALLHYDYPGNVRELENIIRRAVILCRDACVCAHHLAPELLARDPWPEPSPSPSPSPSGNFHEAKARAIEEFERSYLTTILHDCGGIVSRAARRAGLSERNFHEKLNRYGILYRDFRAPHGPVP